MGEAKRRRQPNKIPIIAPEYWQPIGNKALTMAVVFGTATLRGGIPIEDRAIPHDQWRLANPR